MANTSSRRFLLKFVTSVGKVRQLSIPRSVASKSAASTEIAMIHIMQNGAVVFPGAGIPISSKAAYIIETDRTKVF